MHVFCPVIWPVIVVNVKVIEKIFRFVFYVRLKQGHAYVYMYMMRHLLFFFLVYQT